MTDSSPSRAIRVLAADDSTTMRSLLKMLFQLHGADADSPLPRMELCGSVADGAECLQAVALLKPDVLLLDFEMPGLNGTDVLTRLKTEAPRLPVIMCSAYTERGAKATLEALALGAKDYVMKPSQQRDVASAIDQLAQQLLPKIAALASPKTALPRVALGSSGASWSIASSPVATERPTETAVQQAEARAAISATVSTSQPLPRAFGPQLHRVERGRPVEIVVIGVSTGGPSALESMLPMLPADLAVPVLIVQHMPKLFTGALAERLDRLCALPVVEAHDGETLGARGIWIAPGDVHMEVIRGAGSRCAGVLRLHHGEALNGCRPSVDHLFRSAALGYGAGVLGIMLTGMGSDGFAGAVEVHRAGGTLIAQDEASSAVWGMPGRVSRGGIAAATLPLGEIAREVVRRVTAADAARSRAEGNRSTQDGRSTAGWIGRRHGLL